MPTILPSKDAYGNTSSTICGELLGLSGVPAVLTLAWLGLRTLGTSNPVLAAGLTLLVGSLGSSALDAPWWFWPVAIGAVGCVLIALLGARAGQAT